WKKSRPARGGIVLCRPVPAASRPDSRAGHGFLPGIRIRRSYALKRFELEPRRFNVERSTITMQHLMKDSGIVETEWIVFKASNIHGTGGFARTAIPVGTRMIEYVGDVIDKQESLRRCEQHNQYIFE